MDHDGLEERVSNLEVADQEQVSSVPDLDGLAALRQHVRKMANDTGINLELFFVNLDNPVAMTEALDFMADLMKKAACGETIFGTHGLTGRPASSAKEPKFPLPEKFEGSSDPRRAEVFLDLLERAFAVTGLTKDKWVVFGEGLLKGEASAHFADVTQQVDVSSMSWDDFRTILLSAYGSHAIEPAARAALDKLSFRGSVRATARHLKDLMGRITTLKVGPGEAIHRFIGALPVALQDRCRCRPDGQMWTNLEDLTAFAALQEPYVLPAAGKAKADVAGAAAGPSSANGNGAKGDKGGSGKHFKAKDKFQKNGGVKKKSGNSGMPSHVKFGLSRSEYQSRMQRKVCLFCDGEGHRVGECPEMDKASKGLASSAGNKPAMPLSFKKA